MTALVVFAIGLGVCAAGWGAGAWWLDRYGVRPPPRSRYDAIIVAGCRVMLDGRPSPALARRVRLAIRLFQEGYAPVLVLTGGKGVPPPPISEAEAAARMCREAGISDAALKLEEASRTTLQNAAFAAKLVSGSVLVVSDSYHTFRCERMFGRHFEHVDAVGPERRGPHAYRAALREAFNVVRHALAGRL